MTARILVVDDDRDFLEVMHKRLVRLGFDNIILDDDPVRAVDRLKKGRVFDLALLDMTMPRINGLDLIDRIKAYHPDTECIMITAAKEVEIVVACIKKGAYDYLVKPVSQEDLSLSIQRALEHKRLLHILDLDKGRTHPNLINPSAFSAIQTQAPKVLRVLREAELHAASDVPILITGESGTGKELLARGIHRASPRAAFRFTAVNMASMDGALFDAEFFGHTKGAFTGAQNARQGYLEYSHRGTLFLDEIAQIPLSVQGKLLRFLQDGSFSKLGTSTHQRADIRFIAATNADLQKMMDANRFRRDLFYRIRGGWLHLPPLRDRPEDIPLLTQFFLGSEKHASLREVITEAALTRLKAYDFPGNIRELQFVLQSAANLAQKTPIRVRHLPPALRQPKRRTKVAAVDAPDAIQPLALVEQAHILNAYHDLGFNKSRTARALGIGLNTLRRKLARYDVP